MSTKNFLLTFLCKRSILIAISATVSLTYQIADETGAKNSFEDNVGFQFSRLHVKDPI